jgi:SAM-dependent methyltransferase
MHEPSADWNARYAEPGWAFGTEPNDFLREHAAALPPAGRVLCLAEGEGRNAVHLAGLGHDVLAVDRAAVGLEKAQALARARGVSLATVVADLARFPLEPLAWDGIVSVFAHVEPDVRRALHAQVPHALRPGGVLLLEAYTPSQVERGTGGPPDAARLMTLAALRDELPGLVFEVARETERDVIEGRFHTGRASVVQVVARRP